MRFEFWATSGQFLSRKPIAAGSFRLTKGKGEQLALRDKFPADDYDGPENVDTLRAQMKKAMVGPVAKSADEILGLSVVSDFAYGAYWDTKLRYRKITGAVLWHDPNGDGVCRFVSYNFISNEAGASTWAKLRFKSFCNGCKEGDVKCPN